MKYFVTSFVTNFVKKSFSVFKTRSGLFSCPKVILSQTSSDKTTTEVKPETQVAISLDNNICLLASAENKLTRNISRI